MSTFFFPNPKTECLTDLDQKLYDEVIEAMSYALLGHCYYRELHNKSFVWAPNCHSMVRGIAHVCPHLKYRSGYYWGFEGSPPDDVCWLQMEHSWFETPDKAIIDPYPMQAHAKCEVILVSTEGQTEQLGGNCYKAHDDLLIEFGQVGVWQQAQKFVELHRLGITRERHQAMASR